MLLREFFDIAPPEYQDLSQDNSQPRIESLRKTKLTLSQIKKLRMMNDVRTVEFHSKMKEVQEQFGVADNETGV